MILLGETNSKEDQYAMVLPHDLNERLYNAACIFWNTRAMQFNRQQGSTIHDQGNRSAVTGGKQLDGFVNLTYDILVYNGVPKDSIFIDSYLELPGYYRPSKKWDLLIVHRGILLAAIEFKSQVGPSFGNNFNNRTEEAMGSALDIWTAYREGAFGNQEAPWLGYFMVLQDSDKSNTPVRISSPHFAVFPEFEGSSYKDRYEIFCAKLVLERQYNAACFITTGLDIAHTPFLNCPAEHLSYYRFITSLLSNVIARINEIR